MTTLTEFLTARIEEDRKMAQDAIDDPYGIGDYIFFDTGNTDLAEHYERYNPQRILREVAAKRAIITDHLEDQAAGHDCAAHSRSLQSEHSGCYAISHLAAVYSEHPDYREEWKP